MSRYCRNYKDSQGGGVRTKLEDTQISWRKSPALMELRVWWSVMNWTVSSLNSHAEALIPCVAVSGDRVFREMRACMFSGVWLFMTLWTVARQAPLSMGFSRQEYWSGLPFPSPGDLPNSGTKPESLVSWIGRQILYSSKISEPNIKVYGWYFINAEKNKKEHKKIFLKYSM